MAMLFRSERDNICSARGDYYHRTMRREFSLSVVGLQRKRAVTLMVKGIRDPSADSNPVADEKEKGAGDEGAVEASTMGTIAMLKQRVMKRRGVANNGRKTISVVNTFLSGNRGRATEGCDFAEEESMSDGP
ncbi:hypothetical protein B296_00019849 [Ensete ventricosum]|uniref:Uncharacterized protein n=1 Tax=Ensete ventricosum TaxID=4639 RepID=A0A426YVX3_ENSVE|nr:hypothetical protein B296_00019849 [Ensete ventricosum]